MSQNEAWFEPGRSGGDLDSQEGYLSSKYHIPMSSPDLTDAEREAVAAVLRTPSLSMGSEITGFEAAFCAYTGLRMQLE